MAEEKYNFQKLTPINDAELSIYKNALDFVFNNPDLKNVGVSGAYSAGKSSVIETYKKLKPDVKFMHITLAYFQSASESVHQPTEQNENVLEGKILNQLIHQIEPDKIPQTNFRVKHQLSPKKLWLSTLMVKSLNRVYNTFSTEGISNPKMDVLVAQRIIPMTSDVLLFMREHYPQKQISFIKRNIKSYTEEVLTAETFDFDELLNLLTTDVADKYKLKLLQHTEEPISAMSELYSVELKAHILQHNLDTSDLPMLLKTYSSLAESLQTIVFDIANRSFDKIIENEYPVPMALCKKLLSNATLDKDVRLQLLAVAAKDLSKSECKECLEVLSQRALLSVFDGKRPALPITDANEKILDVMIKKHWIVGYNVDKRDETMYRVSSKRIQKQQNLPTELL